MDGIKPPTSDDTQEVRGNPDGTRGGHYGNAYDSHDNRSPPQVVVGSGNGGMGIAADPAGADNGRRGWVDQRTGEVHGSGAGAGGGNAGDELDQDDAGGSGARHPDAE